MNLSKAVSFFLTLVAFTDSVCFVNQRWEKGAYLLPKEVDPLFLSLAPGAWLHYAPW